MRTPLRILSFALLLLALPAFAADSVEYRELRAARLDGRRVEVKDFTLVRDAYTFRFAAGAFHFLAPAAGRTFGAIFVGTGTYELRAASESERRQLALVTNTRDLEVYSDAFESLVLLFADKTAEEISAAGTATSGAPDARVAVLYDAHLNEQKRTYRINLHLRVLQDLLNAESKGGVFLAAVDSAKNAPALLIVDPLGISSVAARFADLSGEETALLSFDQNNGGFWYLGSARDKRALGVAPLARFDAQHYAVDTTIESNLAVSGTTTIRLVAKTGGVRVIPIHILPKLRIRSASWTPAGGAAVDGAVVQEEVDLGKFARLFRDEVADADAAVVLPEAVAAGTTGELRLTYDGREVLQSIGPDSYSVRARESWYPNTGTFIDLATYDLTYRFPKKNDLISTGTLVSETEESGTKRAVWKAATPMRVAGFNYGRFEKITRKDEQSGVHVDVYTHADRRKFASDSMADALNTARLGNAYFGKTPYSPVSVTQQSEWNFGQSWPSLIYLPTLALTSSTERVEIFEEAGPEVFAINEFAKMVGWHEFAHQWWGHAVGWQSYRDQWLSEGFAEFTAALVLHFTESGDKYDDFWERKRREILQKQRGTLAPNDAGPISQGFRLATRHSPAAAQVVMYSKGAYVVHMLRMMMRDTRSQNADEKFITMMRDFVATWNGKSPSTADFQKIVEKHMTKQMDATGNGSMAWFFNQWVYGVEVPKFKSTLTAKDVGGGKVQISGAVSQEGVSNDFVSLVPLAADFGKDGVHFIGSIRLTGPVAQTVETQLAMPRVPKRIVVNPMHAVLARD